MLEEPPREGREDSMAIFYDTEPQVAVHSGLTIVENVPVTIQISGVFYYTLLSTFTVAIADIDWTASDTYPATLITITGTEYGLPALNLAGTDLTGWNPVFDDINSTYSKNDWAINAVNFCTVSNTANISSQIFDWVAGGTIVSANDSICVNTYNDTSTRTFEPFRLETRRRTSTWAAWDNTQNLNAYDDSLGLQFQCDRLLYPTVNFTTYDPVPGSQPNYFGSAGTRTFFWSCYHTSTSHSNGIFVFSDHNIVEADITGGNFDFDISLDGVAWYNLNALYAGGALNDGDGCRIDSGVYNITANSSIRFTLGVGGFTAAGTGPEGWGIYVRWRWAAAMSGRYVGGITVSDW